MISPIKKNEGKVSTDVETTLSKDKFEILIKDVYDIMLQYSHMRRTILKRNSPIQIGNATFWFEVDKESNEPQLKFSPSPKLWNEESIMHDIQMYIHDLYYNGNR